MKLLISDYDNTYEMHYQYVDIEGIFLKNYLSVEEFMKNGNIFCLCTGRHFDDIKKTIDERNLKFNYLCCNMGAEVYDKNYNPVSIIAINDNDLLKVKQLDKDYNVYYRNPCNINNIITSINVYLDDIIEYEKVKSYLDNSLEHSKIEYKYPKIKIINEECDKSITPDIINQTYNLPKEDIFVIGDDKNDLNIIRKYNGCTLMFASEEVKGCSSKVYKELNEYIKDILKNNER